MKKYIPFVIACMALTFSGCKKLDKLTQFYIDYNSEVTYQPTGGLPLNLPIELFSPDVTTNAEQEFAINDTRKDLIESIRLKQLTLTITAPQGETFSFLKSVELYISAPNLGEVKIAQKLNVPNTVGGQIDLDLLDVELKEYIKSDVFKLRAVSTTDETITNTTSVNIYSKFFVDAKILGL